MYHFAKIIRQLFLKLPLGALYCLGKITGLIFYLTPTKRRVAFKNMKSAFPEKSGQETKAILKKSFRNFGLTIIESLVVPRIYGSVTSKEKEDSYPEGGIFVGIHAGNWEIAISHWAHKYKFAVFAQEQKHSGLDKFLNELRQENKIKVCFTLKELIKCIKENYMVGVVIDHGAETEALAVRFFSHLVPTPKGAIYLAKKFNKKIYATFCYRTNERKHVLEVGHAIDAHNRDDVAILTQLNEIYEDYLKKYPWEYFWYYKRFKRKINRDVIILNDEKTGHLKQSKSLLSILKEEDYKIRSVILEVKYKNQPCRMLAEILALLAGKNWLSCGKMLKLLLDKKSWDKIDKTYADIIISTGSLMAPINKLLSSYLGAKSAVILKPNIALHKFDLSIIPKHDRVQAKEAVTIKGALFHPEKINEKINKCSEFLKINPGKQLAVFIGGPISDKKEFIDNLKIFLKNLKILSEKNSYKLLVSTSRRTPLKAEKVIKAQLKDFSQTDSLIIASEKNYDFIFEAFASIAEYVFVTSESISMISETAILNESCICVFLETEDCKRKVFLDSIKNEITFLKEPFDIKLDKSKKSLLYEKNKAIVKKNLHRIL